jgi:hypothetical protein
MEKKEDTGGRETMINGAMISTFFEQKPWGKAPRQRNSIKTNKCTEGLTSKHEKKA